jgi:hypothetical protein
MYRPAVCDGVSSRVSLFRRESTMKAKLVGSSALAFLAFAGIANAQISSIGPFTGQQQEGFNGGNFGFALCVPQRVFNNTADLCDTTGTGAHVTSGWSFMCTIFPHTPPTFFGSAGGPAQYTFDNPVKKFGGYFGTNAITPGNPAGGVAEFFDNSGASLGTQPINFSSNCDWTWNGWESTSSNIKRVKITGNNPFGGGFVDMDDMEVSAGSSCYADCNGDGVLGLADFGCFQTKFALGDPYADCNGDGVLGLADFGCFQTKFALGCP